MLKKQSFYKVNLISLLVLTGVLLSSSLTTLAADPLPKAYQAFLDKVGGSHFIEVNGAKIHYVESGPSDGPTLLLLYGSPANVFSWRNIIPTLAQQYHVIAPDFLGFGLSDSPDIQYTWTTEIKYLTDFIAAKNLQHITLVGAEIGGIFGFAYASNHPDNVAGIVFWEAETAPISNPQDVTNYCEQCLTFFPKDSKTLQDFFVSNAGLAEFIYGGKGPLLHPLSGDELAGYSYFLSTPAQRKVFAQIRAQMPIAGDVPENVLIQTAYAKYLRTNNVPKLLLYANPGIFLPEKQAKGLGLANTQIVSVGNGKHYLTEDEPQAINSAILAWRANLSGTGSSGATVVPAGNSSGNQAATTDGNNQISIIVILLAALILVGGAIFLWLRTRNKRA